MIEIFDRNQGKSKILYLVRGCPGSGKTTLARCRKAICFDACLVAFRMLFTLVFILAYEGVIIFNYFLYK